MRCLVIITNSNSKVFRSKNFKKKPPKNSALHLYISTAFKHIMKNDA